MEAGNARFGSKADIGHAEGHVRFSPKADTDNLQRKVGDWASLEICTGVLYLIRDTVTQTKASLHSMEIQQQKAEAAAQKENLRVHDDRQHLAIRIAQALRDAGFECEVAALPTIH